MENQRVRSIIIEDELYDRQLIEKILSSYYADYIEVVDSVDNAADAIASINKNHPQLLFMDIELNGDRKGAFDILDKVEQNFRVIFVTAKSDQDDLLKAIRLSCIDYLVKPTKVSDFEVPVKKVFTELNTNGNNIAQNINVLHHNIDVHSKQEAKVSLQEGFSYRPVSIKNIVRCESQGNYTQFSFTDKTDSLVNGNLKSFEERLTGFGFCRINKTDLVNLFHIKAFSRRNSSWELLMTDNTTRFISPSRKQSFLMQYNNMHLIY